jgi:hypothetical protein
MPYEYAEVYYTNSRSRMFWTAAYLLQAFLSLNPSYGVILAMNFLMSDHINEFHAAFPHYDPKRHTYVSHTSGFAAFAEILLMPRSTATASASNWPGELFDE